MVRSAADLLLLNPQVKRFEQKRLSKFEHNRLKALKQLTVLFCTVPRGISLVR
jgi:hypothetical protein